MIRGRAIVTTPAVSNKRPLQLLIVGLYDPFSFSRVPLGQHGSAVHLQRLGIFSVLSGVSICVPSVSLVCVIVSSHITLCCNDPVLPIPP